VIKQKMVIAEMGDKMERRQKAKEISDQLGFIG